MKIAVINPNSTPVLDLHRPETGARVRLAELLAASGQSPSKVGGRAYPPRAAQLLARPASPGC